MPQAVIPILAQAGLSTVATLGLAAASIAATYFISDLLQGSPPKPDAAEREARGPKPARIHVLGMRRVHGSSMLFTNTTESETVDVWAFCEGPVNAVVQAYLNDDKVTITGGYVEPLADDSYGNNKVLAGYNLGAFPNIAHAPVVSRVSAWTANHRGDGIVSGYLIKTGVGSKSFLDVYPQGDNVSMSLVVQGHFCHDPRVPSSDPYNPSTWAYTQNAALHLLWFKSVFCGEDYNAKFKPIEQYWIDAADDCDAAVALSAGGTEPKYRSCVMFAADANPSDIEGEILAAFDGWTATDENGCWKVYSGKVYAPTITIGPDKIIDYELQEFVEDENRLNEIIVRHISQDHDFNEVEPDAWGDESDILERGKIVSTTLNLQVPTHTQARRLAKRKMARAAAPQQGKVSVVFSGRDALAERYINLVIEESGETLFSGVVEVLGGERNYDTGGASIEWVAVDANVDTWHPATEDGTPAPTAEKIYLPPLTAPTIATATTQIDGSGTFARIAVTFDPISATAPTWFVRWRVDGEVSYIEQTTTPAGNTLLSGAVPADATIDVGISYSSGGRFSGWSADTTVSTSTAALAPSSPTEVGATGTVAAATVTWRNPSSANLSYVKVFRNTDDDFDTATAISGEIVGGLGQVMSINDTGLSAGTKWYWVVAYNTAGVASSPGGPASATVT